ncbi:hypothetical protein GQ651_17700 [Alphaproteobacteria bacterium GH1-50]|uniref:Sensory transduction regulator n=1 Tax=Kangsaoukella pontilimi TaxID=2691042 RepID=A0A7C9ISE1_9RHOB|nr:hypothetical protein [Kangsaoukella pontilimi]MXQ09683.1 hypothetical protein [Kangsaoukella pontilimi]
MSMPPAIFAAAAVLLSQGFAPMAFAGTSDAMEIGEFAAETEVIVAATVDLFEAAEAATDRAEEPAFQIGEPTATPAGLTPDEATLGAFPEAYGAVRHLTGYRITWYPMERLMGAVDFMGTWNKSRNLVCGYVAWDLTDPDAPTLERVVTNYVDLEQLDGSDRAEIETVLLEANCAFGEIEANYAVFQ